MASDHRVVEESDLDGEKAEFQAQNAQAPKTRELGEIGDWKYSNKHEEQRYSSITAESLLPSYLKKQAVFKLHQADGLHAYDTSEKAHRHFKELKGKDYLKHLDGLRGIASLVLFNFHFLFPWTYTILHGFGTPNGNRFAHQMPLLCLVVRGQAMITLSFAVSGYVLSCKISQLAEQRDSQTELDLFRPLSAYSIRRAIRLYVPPMTSMAIVGAFVRLGAFERGATVQKGEADGTYWLSGSREHHPEKLANSLAQMLNLLSTLRDWGNPWTGHIIHNHYDPHTWTIPLELRSSIILFIAVIATVRLRGLWKLAITTAVAFQALRIGRWEIAIFLGSKVVAEKDLVHLEAKGERKHCDKNVSAKLALLTFSTLIMGLYMLSFPDLNAELSPGFITLAGWTPSAYKSQHYFWHAIGSLMVLWCSNNSMTLKKMLESQFCQYFGKISFAFYLVHGPLLHSVGLAIMPAIWRWTGYHNVIGFACGLLIAWVVMIFLSTWAAEMFQQLVDMPCRRFAKTVERTINA